MTPGLYQSAQNQYGELPADLLTVWDFADLPELVCGCRRGDVELIERSLFLKRELESREENRGHLWDTTEKSPEELVAEMNLAHWRK